MRFNNRLSRWCEHYHVVAVGYLRTLGHVAQGRIDVPPFPTLPSPSLSRARFQDGPSLVLRTSSVRAAESRGAITHTHTLSLSLSLCLSVCRLSASRLHLRFPSGSRTCLRSQAIPELTGVD